MRRIEQVHLSIIKVWYKKEEVKQLCNLLHMVLGEQLLGSHSHSPHLEVNFALISLILIQSSIVMKVKTII